MLLLSDDEASSMFLFVANALFRGSSPPAHLCALDDVCFPFFCLSPLAPPSFWFFFFPSAWCWSVLGIFFLVVSVPLLKNASLFLLSKKFASYLTNCLLDVVAFSFDDDPVAFSFDDGTNFLVRWLLCLFPSLSFPSSLLADSSYGFIVNQLYQYKLCCTWLTHMSLKRNLVQVLLLPLL